MKSRKIALYGVLVALALILSYVETLVPVSFAVPGVKMGLPNIAVLFALYKLGFRDACVISLVRVVLSSLLFGSAFSMVYSLAGAVLSLAVMLLLFRCGKFSAVGVSVAGGVAHNIGQILVAVFILETGGLLYYLPVLCISGVAAGILVGLASALLIRRVDPKIK